MWDEKNVCILHRCSKAIVNIYIYTLKKYFVYIYILQTYSSDFSGAVYCKVDVCEYRIIFGVCVLLVCLVCWCTVNGMFYFVFLKWYNRPLERCFRSTKFREKGGDLPWATPWTKFNECICYEKQMHQQTHQQKAVLCFWYWNINRFTCPRVPG